MRLLPPLLVVAVIVSVLAGARLQISAQSPQGGAIHGRVSHRDTGAGVAGVAITIVAAAGPRLGAKTDADGFYTLAGLPTGTYFVQTNAPRDSFLIDEAYRGKRCWLETCDLKGTDPVSVKAPATTSGIDFVLSSGATIAGTVTVAGTGTAVAGASVIVRRKDLGPAARTAPTTTDAEGRYRSPALVTGDYTVEAWPPASRNPSNLIRVMFGGRVCAYYGCPLEAGEGVHVAEPNQTSPVDLALPLGGSISGTLTDAVSGQPVGYARVTATSESFQARTVSTLDGKYSITALVTGTYSVEAQPAWEGAMGAPRELWPLLERLATQTYATRVPVTAPQPVANIDFALKARR
jgi:hypothetical protein